MRFDAAALQVDELAHECQPDTHAAVPSRDPRIALLEQLEDARHEFGRYPLAVVLDVEPRFVAVAVTRTAIRPPGGVNLTRSTAGSTRSA